MKASEIKQLILNLVEELTGKEDFEELNPNEDIHDALEIDSFDLLNLLIAINEELGINVPEADYEQLGSVNDMIGYLKARL